MDMTAEMTPERRAELDARVQRKLKKRYRAAKRFHFYCVGSLVLAISFLAFFFTDMISKGHSAFQQAHVQVDVDYAEKNLRFTKRAIAEDMHDIVSRGWLRDLRRVKKENPELVGTKAVAWALADDEVDQYLKGNKDLTGDDNTVEQKALAARIDALKADGKIKMKFNVGFFTNGDSKIPEMSGLWSAMVGSILVMVLTLLFSFPIGVMTAIYLEEFAPDNRLTQLIEININNLAAVPSILFGLLGLAIFINFFGVPRSSALAGGLTLGLMTLPVIIISTRAALRAVPDTIRQAAYGMGCTEWRTVRDHVLPLSMPGILTGTIIGIAQAMGETAPLLIIGMMAYIPEAPEGFLQAATVLPAQIFTWAGMPERAYVERTAAGILVLMSVLILMNASAVLLRKKFERRW